MLQWMGGSRRKVTTSRKSTDKRQKQYFEQRKRQQQQHTAGLESYADGRRSCTENNRSLDILSLADVSPVAQERKTRCIDGNKSEDYDFTLDHQYALPYQAILNDEALPVDQDEINEERTSSSYGAEAEYAEKVSVHLPVHNEDLVGNGNKLDPFKLSAALCLGKVEPETPLHSPKLSGRSFPNVFSPRRKARTQPIISSHMDYSFDDLGAQVDVVVQDVDFSAHYSSIDQTFCSKDMLNIIGDQNPIFSNRRGSSPFYWDGSNSQGTFDSDELICNIRDSGRNIWDASGFLDELGEHDTFCTNWADQRNVPQDDYFHNNDLWKQGFNLDGWNLQKKRFSTKRTEDFDIRESPVPYKKHQTTKDLSDKISNTRYSDIRIDNVVKDAVNCFVREDNRESLSRLSQESCSSTAVMGDATRKP